MLRYQGLAAPTYGGARNAWPMETSKTRNIRDNLLGWLFFLNLWTGVRSPARPGVKCEKWGHPFIYTLNMPLNSATPIHYVYLNRRPLSSSNLKTDVTQHSAIIRRMNTQTYPSRLNPMSSFFRENSSLKEAA
jgi:hypothetical protein